MDKKESKKVREHKLYMITLNEVTDSDKAFVNKFVGQTKEVLEYLIKTPVTLKPHLKLKIEYIITEDRYRAVKASIIP